MSHRYSHKLPRAYDVAEFLADREGLVGAARIRFLRLLREYGSFRQVSRPQRSRTLILVSLVLTLAGFVFDSQSGWGSGLVWFSCLLLSLGPVWRFHREESRLLQPDRGSDWRTYCHFLRPVVLSDNPGLLDRNLRNLQLESTQPMYRTIPMLGALIQERGPDFWWSIVLGLWCGMTALLLITHLAITATNWMQSLTFPVGGMLFGPVIWAVWRRIIYLMAKSDVRLSDSLPD